MQCFENFGGANAPNTPLVVHLAPNHYGGAKYYQQCHKYFLQQQIYFRKTSGSSMEAPNLFLAPDAI